MTRLHVIDNLAELTPNKGNPRHRFGKLQPDLPNIALLVTTPDSQNLCNIAFHKIYIFSSFAFDTLLLLSALCAKVTCRPKCSS